MEVKTFLAREIVMVTHYLIKHLKTKLIQGLKCERVFTSMVDNFFKNDLQDVG